MSTHFPSSVSSSLFPPLPRFLLRAQSSFTFSRTSSQLSLLWPSLYTFLTGPSPSARLPIIYTQISCSLGSSLLYLPLLCRSSCLLKTKKLPRLSLLRPSKPISFTGIWLLLLTPLKLSSARFSVAISLNPKDISVLRSLQHLTHLPVFAVNPFAAPSAIHNAHTPERFSCRSDRSLSATGLSSLPCLPLLVPRSH